jgi:adenine-specific DNA-methyltransferase
LKNDINIVDGYSTEDFILEGEFKWTQDFLDDEISKGTTFVIKSEKLSIRFIRDEDGFKRPANFIKEKYTTPLINKEDNGVGTNENASSLLSSIMGGDYFDYPKPVSLLKYLMNFKCSKDDIVLDFFSGSGTTAETVMEYNKENKSNLKYILVQLPETLNPENAIDSNAKKKLLSTISFLEGISKNKNVCEIGKERIRRVGTQIKQKNNDCVLDIGFRVLKLDSSNMKEVYFNPSEISQQNLFESVNNIKEDRSDLDLLFGVLIDWGVDLTLPITKETIQGKTCYFVDEDSLCACFEDSIDEEFIKELASKDMLKVVFKDSSFGNNDDLKDNVSQIFKQLNPNVDIKVI